MGNSWKISIIVILGYYGNCFQFAAPQVTCDNCVINQLTFYNVILYRMFAADLSETPYAFQTVPAGSTIVVNFPPQFTLQGTQTCSLVMIDSNIITSYTCTPNVASKSITVSGAITAPTYIGKVILIIEGVLNPYPAIVTSPFTATIGSDYSINAAGGVVTLLPGALKSLAITFSNTTVNTTSSMIITATLGNAVAAGGSIIVTFPTNLKWTRELSSGHTLALPNTMACSAISSNINSVIGCSGSTTTNPPQVTVTNIFGNSLAAGSVISFSINSIFSPPTTQPDLDYISVLTYNGTYQIDSLSASISGLTPKSINLVVSSSSNLTINSGVPLIFNFTLADTISKIDYIVITFPSGSIVNYATSACTQLSLPSNLTSYSSANRQLTLLQSNSSANKNANSIITIIMQSYQTPSSARIASPFTLSIMTNSGLKMTGSTSITILPKSYTATLSTNNTTINTITSYTLSFALTDSISTTGYMIVNIPSQISLSGSISVALLSNSSQLATAPFISVTNTTGNSSIKISSLNSTAYNLSNLSVTMTISGLVQPASVRTISAFTVLIYFSSANDLVGQATTTSTISTTPGFLSSPALSTSSSTCAASSVTYTFTIVIGNALNANSSLQVSVPTAITLVAGGACQLQSASVSCAASSQLLTVSVPSAYSANSILVFSYNSFTNPASTKTTTSFNISTFNSASQLVDILPSNLQITLTMRDPSALQAVSLSRTSVMNSQSAVYTILFTQPQILTETTAIASIVFPSDFALTSAIACNSGTTQLICSLSGNNNNTVQVKFTPSPTSNYPYNISISNVVNPYSFKPTPSLSITTLSSDTLYKYSTISSGLGIVNTITSAFDGLSYSFSVQSLNSATSLSVQVNSSVNAGYLLLQFANSFQVTSTSGLSCSADTFNPICNIVTNSSTGVHYLKVQSTSTIPLAFNLTISSLRSPSTIPTDYTTLSSYTAGDHDISSNANILFTTYCTFPCSNCLANNRAHCLSCYTTVVTPLIYLFNNSCVSTCPAGYYIDTVSQSCQPCNLPCLSCTSSPDNCTSCNTTSDYKYLNKTATSGTCVSECPAYMFEDTSQIPQVCSLCISPCAHCSSLTNCTTCLSPYYYYNYACLTLCPSDITVLVNSECIDCSKVCAKCSMSPTNCTQCASQYVLYNSSCSLACPSNMVNISNVCTACDTSCLSCSLSTTNCTSCNISSQYPFTYGNQCLPQCPDFYYYNTFKLCLSCDALNIGCKNCTSPTVCLSCDPTYVYLNSKCLSIVPQGYLNVSGIAVPCEGDCATCSLTVSNCTSCKSLYLYINTCEVKCPVGYIGLNRECVACLYPCSQCVDTISTCTKCASNSSLYLYKNACVTASSCPSTTFPDSVGLICSSCVTPCSQCVSLTICLSCRANYFYINSTSFCQTSCPPGSVGISRVCMACTSPCLDCQHSITNCTSCQPSYFFNSKTNECLSACPDGKIANDTTMQCDSCQNPCKTCTNTTDTCTSCVNNTYLSNSLCVNICPSGQYGQSGLCTDCQNNCTTCSSATVCLSCTLPLYLYARTCIENCPQSHAIISNSSVCTACSTLVPSCVNCSASGECYACLFPMIYFQGYCVASCPENYTYTNYVCQPLNITTVVLEYTLKSSTFPIPFTILGCVIFIACCISKLQNSNTYFIGLLYSMFGLVQTGSLAFLIYNYYILDRIVFVWNSQLILFIVAGIIYAFNFLTMIIQTPYLLSDQRFVQWSRSSSNKCFLSFVTLVSFFVNYKFRMILFSRLFRFHCTSALLNNVSKFRIFNIFSFFGIVVQALALYVCFISIFNFIGNSAIFYAFLDVIIVFSINALLALLIAWKPDDFFHETMEDGIAINKKVSQNGDDFSKQAILAENDYDQLRYHGPDSYAIFKKSNHTIQEVSDKTDDFTNQQNNEQSNVKVYFANTTNSRFMNLSKDGKLDSIQQDVSGQDKTGPKVKNIFSIPSEFQQDNLSHNKQQLSGEWDYSEPQGDKALNKSNLLKAHKTLVVKAPHNSDKGAYNNDLDVEKEIYNREIFLQQVKQRRQEEQKNNNRQQQQQQQQQQKQKSEELQQENQQEASSQKLEQNNSISYEQLTIKDSSQKHKTEQSFLETKSKAERVQNLQKDKLKQQNLVEQKPQDTITSNRSIQKVINQYRKQIRKNNNNLKSEQFEQSQQQKKSLRQKNRPPQSIIINVKNAKQSFKQPESILKTESEQLHLNEVLKKTINNGSNQQQNEQNNIMEGDKQSEQKIIEQNYQSEKKHEPLISQKQQSMKKTIKVQDNYENKNEQQRRQNQHFQQSQQSGKKQKLNKIFEVEKKQLSQINSKSMSSQKYMQYQIQNQYFEEERIKQKTEADHKKQKRRMQMFEDNKRQMQEDSDLQKEGNSHLKSQFNNPRYTYTRQIDNNFNTNGHDEIDQRLQKKQFQNYNTNQKLFQKFKPKTQTPNQKFSVKNNANMYFQEIDVDKDQYEQVLKQKNRKNRKRKMDIQMQENQRDEFDKELDHQLRIQNKIKDQLNQSLQNSDRFQNQTINERPYSATKRKGAINNVALLQILTKAQQQKAPINSRGGASHKKIPNQQFMEEKFFKHSGGPSRDILQQDPSAITKVKTKLQKLSRNISSSQGIRSGQQILARKQTLNYPLSSSKNKSTEMKKDESLNKLIEKNNKSINSIPNRKYVSRDISSDNLNQLDMQQLDVNKNYQDLLNGRLQLKSHRKSVLSIQTPSNNFNLPSGRNPNRLWKNQMQEIEENDDNMVDDEQLKRYYNKYRNKSSDKKKRKKEQSQNN